MDSAGSPPHHHPHPLRRYCSVEDLVFEKSHLPENIVRSVYLVIIGDDAGGAEDETAEAEEAGERDGGTGPEQTTARDTDEADAERRSDGGKGGPRGPGHSTRRQRSKHEGAPPNPPDQATEPPTDSPASQTPPPLSPSPPPPSMGESEKRTHPESERSSEIRIPDSMKDVVPDADAATDGGGGDGVDGTEVVVAAEERRARTHGEEPGQPKPGSAEGRTRRERAALHIGGDARHATAAGTGTQTGVAASPFNRNRRSLAGDGSQTDSTPWGPRLRSHVDPDAGTGVGGRSGPALRKGQRCQEVSLDACLEARLFALGLDLTAEPYTDKRGRGGLPAALVWRLAEEARATPAEVAPALERVRVRLLRAAREIPIAGATESPSRSRTSDGNS